MEQVVGGKTIEPTDPLYPRVVQRLLQAKKDILPEFRQEAHVCKSWKCNPQNEETCIKKGWLQGFPLSSNVFLCDQGKIHCCTEQACKEYGLSQTHTCPISGFQYGMQISSYDKNNASSWYAPRLELIDEPSVTEGGTVTKRKKKVAKTISAQEVEEKASAVVTNLLFSPKRRECNTSFFAKQAEKAATEIALYVKQQQRDEQFPCWVEMYKIRAYYSSREPPLVEFAYNKTLHDLYVGIITQVWEKVQTWYLPSFKEGQQRPRIAFETVAIGTLYRMRIGYTLNGQELLPCDKWLKKHLPKGADLQSFFGYAKATIRDGDKVITQMFDVAHKSGVSIVERMIDVAALAERQKQRTEEKLFKPVARKKRPRKLGKD